MLNIDWICLALIVLLAILGFRRGLIGEFFRILSFAAGLVAGFSFSLRWIHKIDVGGGLGSKVLLVLLFLCSFALVAGAVLLIGKVVRKIVRLTLLGWIDRLGGLTIGLLKGVLISGFLVWTGTFIPFLDAEAKMKRSKIARHSVSASSILLRTGRKLANSRHFGLAIPARFPGSPKESRVPEPGKN